MGRRVYHLDSTTPLLCVCVSSHLENLDRNLTLENKFKRGPDLTVDRLHVGLHTNRFPTCSAHCGNQCCPTLVFFFPHDTKVRPIPLVHHLIPALPFDNKKQTIKKRFKSHRQQIDSRPSSWVMCVRACVCVGGWAVCFHFAPAFR